jgi:glycosyltransferase involved in cell wall biosynthesis
MKSISIIVTAYQSKKFILETLQSIKNQELPDGWKIDVKIGVDGCEETSDFLIKNNIPFYFSKNNVGTYVITNSLLALSYEENSDIFVRFDSDDIACDNFLSNGIKNLQERDLIRSTYIQINETGDIIDQKKISSYGSIFFNRKVLEHLGGYYHHRVACDKDFVSRAQHLGFLTTKAKYPALYYYRRHSQSLTINQNTSNTSVFRQEIEKELLTNLKNKIYKIDPKTVKLTYSN